MKMKRNYNPNRKIQTKTKQKYTMNLTKENLEHHHIKNRKEK